MDNQDFVTKEYLDKKLQDHSQILVEALGGILVKRLDELKDELKKDINNVQVLIDGYVKA